MFQNFQLLEIGFAVYHEAYIGLHIVRIDDAVQHLEQATAFVTPHCKNRMHRNVNGEIVARDCGSDGVNQKRHVVVYHLDDGEARLISVFFFRRAENTQHHLTGFPGFPEFEVRERRPPQDLGRTVLHVFMRHIAKVLAQIGVDFLTG